MTGGILPVKDEKKTNEQGYGQWWNVAKYIYSSTVRNYNFKVLVLDVSISVNHYYFTLNFYIYRL